MTITPSAIVAAGLLLFILFSGALVGCPVYNVWSAKMAGEAELAQATQNRQITVQTAEAEQQAEILRATGTAQANKIIGDSLKGNDTYLRWLWINRLDNSGNKTIVYVPTDGLTPILETGRVANSH